MFDIDLAALRRIGWNDRNAADLADFPSSFIAVPAVPRPTRLLRLTEVHRETLVVHDGHRSLSARVRPALERALRQHGDGLVVGDWVVACAGAQEPVWIEQRLPPRRAIVRRDADGRRHALVSHVDTALFVMGLDADFSARRLERYLLLVPPGVQPVVVLTKSDLVAPDPDMRRAMVADEREALAARIGAEVPIMAVDARSPEAALVLAPWLAAGTTAVLLGSSGAGKSTLTNALLARHVQDTGPVRASDDRGRHTTTSRCLHRLPSGACVIDTPGLRALRPDIDVAALDAGFADIAQLALHCRFRDCGHATEPGCAVREGIDADRLRNYRKLGRELGRDAMSALERQRQRAAWKQRGMEGAERARAKRGG